MKAPIFAIMLWVMFSPALVIAQEVASGVAVMTQNVYNGVDDKINALLTADPDELRQKVAAVYQSYFDRNFPERAAALADHIAAMPSNLRPALIGLQEAIMVRTQDPSQASQATTVEFDYVQILRDALAKRKLKYEVAKELDNLDVELPSAPVGSHGNIFDVRHTDREVILARADLQTSDLKILNSQGGNFSNKCTIPSSSIGTIVFPRGWVAVDAKISGKALRLISTHLDVACPPDLRQAQAKELLDGPAVTQLPVILVGDFNSPADASDASGYAYDVIKDAGFTDVAKEAGAIGATCCRDPDLNTDLLLTSRIDFVLSRGPFNVLSADVLGEDPADKTTSGLWPSDHAGVAAKLEIPSH